MPREGLASGLGNSRSLGIIAAGSSLLFEFESLMAGLGLGASGTSWVGYDTGGAAGVGRGKGPVWFLLTVEGSSFLSNMGSSFLSFMGIALGEVEELIFEGDTSMPSAVVTLSSSPEGLKLSLVEDDDDGELLVLSALVDDDIPIGSVTRGILSSSDDEEDGNLLVFAALVDDDIPFGSVASGILSSLSIVVSDALEDNEEVVLCSEDVLVGREGLLVGLEGLV